MQPADELDAGLAKATEARDRAESKAIDLEADVAKVTAEGGRELGKAVTAAIRQTIDEAVKTIINDLLRGKSAA